MNGTAPEVKLMGLEPVKLMLKVAFTFDWQLESIFGGSRCLG
jgi:hypothetical protein